MLCVSAHEALLGRLCIRGLLTDAQQHQLHERTYPESDVEDISPEMYKKAATKKLLKSGMLEIEKVTLSVYCSAVSGLAGHIPSVTHSSVGCKSSVVTA